MPRPRADRLQVALPSFRRRSSGNTSRSLRPAAAAPHGLGHCWHGGPVHCWVYWLAAVIARGELDPNSAMKNNLGLINPMEKLYTRTRFGRAWVCRLCTARRRARGRRTALPPPRAQRCWPGPAEPHVGCKPTWSTPEAPGTGQDPSKLAPSSAQRLRSWRVLSDSGFCRSSLGFGTCSARAGSAPCCNKQGTRNSA